MLVAKTLGFGGNMKRILHIFIIIVFFVLILTGCNWFKTEDPNKSINDLDISEYFRFNTKRTVTTTINGTDTTDFQIYLEYDGDLDSKVDTTLLDKLFLSTQTDSIGYFEKILSVPSYYNSVYLKYGNQIKELELYKLDNERGEIISSFNEKAIQNKNKCLHQCIYYPSKNNFGTILFEDRWPHKGDYDMNDLVVDYNMVEKYFFNPLFHVPGIGWFKPIYEIEANFRLRASGAGYNISFAMQLPNLCYIDGEVTTDLPEAITIEEDNNTLIFIANLHEAMGAPDGEWVNTEETLPYYSVVEFNVTIPIQYVNGNDPAWDEWNGDRNNPIYLPPYNSFIYVNNNRYHEIHLANYPPTDSMDTTLFGTASDASIPSNGIYYRTINGLPWGVHVAQSCPYPIERTEITEAYLHFAEWAESSGSVFQNWYKNLPGYRDNSNIYILP